MIEDLGLMIGTREDSGWVGKLVRVIGFRMSRES